MDILCPKDSSSQWREAEKRGIKNGGNKRDGEAHKRTKKWKTVKDLFSCVTSWKPDRGDSTPAGAAPLRQALPTVGRTCILYQHRVRSGATRHLFASTEHASGMEGSSMKLAPLRPWVPGPLTHLVSSDPRCQLYSTL